MSSENLSTTAPPSLETIESEIKLIDVKKAELKKAFDDLQANSNHLSSFCISWPDIDSHFTALRNSVTQRFRTLESHDSAHNKPTQPQHRVDSVADSVLTQPLTQPDSVPLNAEKPSCSNSLPPSGRTDLTVTLPELKEFCERMDGKGLRKYVFDRIKKQREAIRIMLPAALKSAPDPGAMVLDAMEGFCDENLTLKDDKEPGLFGLRKVCLVLLEQLMETGLSFGEEVTERAKMLSLEWKVKVKLLTDNYSLETSAFLQLVATYSLGAMFDKDELLDYILSISRLRQAATLCRAIGLGYDLIQKLLDNGKQLFAVIFIFELGLAEKFPPVPLLDEYLKETEKLAKQICKDGNNSLESQNEATHKEIYALKSVKKIIEVCNLEKEYSPELLQKRIKQLKKEKAGRKSPAMPSAPNPPQQQQQQQASQSAAQQASQSAAQQAKKKNKQSPGKQQQGGNKHPKTAASFVPPSAIPPFQQAHHQPAGLLPNHSAAYISPAIPFGLQGSSPFAGPSAAMYGLAGAPRGFPVNPIPAAPPLYNYGRPPAYGAYNFPPQYHPYFHPQ